MQELMVKLGTTFNPTQEFHTYVMSFYGKGGIYAYINMTNDEFTQALIERVSEDPTLFEGDTVDREAIRDIVLRNRGQK